MPILALPLVLFAAQVVSPPGMRGSDPRPYGGPQRNRENPPLQTGGMMQGGMQNGSMSNRRRRTGKRVPGSQGRAFKEAAASVVINGDRLAGAAIVANNRVLVEMRPVFEKLGARVDYIAQENKVNAFTPQHGISLTVGSRMAMMPDSVTLDSPPVMRDGKVYVPLRAVSQAFGATVQWDRRTRTAIVTTDPRMMRNGGTTIGGGTLGSGNGDSPDTSGGTNGGMMGGGRKGGGN